jgi:hypothetical protein
LKQSCGIVVGVERIECIISEMSQVIFLHNFEFIVIIYITDYFKRPYAVQIWHKEGDDVLPRTHHVNVNHVNL